jgi:hypothetical protein
MTLRNHKCRTLNFTPVNSPSATHTKDWTSTSSEFLQSLKLQFNALDWFMLLRNMVTEINLTEIESNCLGWRDGVEFRTQIYVIAPSWYMSNKITRRHMLEENNFHIQCITVYYVRKPLNISECASKIRSFGRLNVWIISRILHIVANLQTYDVCEFSCLQWICTGSVCFIL